MLHFLLILPIVPTIAFTPLVGTGIDLDRLASAVASAETGGCTTGIALTHKNCFGLRAHGEYRTFASFADSFAAFKDVWHRLYGDHLPTMDDAKRYVGDGPADTWLKNVLTAYNRP
jgi:hypothetical protein